MTSENDWNDVLDSQIPIILECGADWCGPCKTLKPMMIKVAKDYPKVQLVYMDIDKFKNLATMMDIKQIPKTFVVFKGELYDTLEGVPQESQIIHDFFKKASDLVNGLPS